MQNRETSDKIAREAALLMRHGNPLDDDTVVDTICRNVADAAKTGTLETTREALREPLRQYFATAKSLAASCISQADGPEG